MHAGSEPVSCVQLIRVEAHSQPDAARVLGCWIMGKTPSPVVACAFRLLAAVSDGSARHADIRYRTTLPP